MAKRKIENYIFYPGLGLNDNLYPNAYWLLENNKSFIQEEVVAWIQAQVDAGVVGFVGYTYNTEKCKRDTGYVIDAWLTDLRYGGNANISKVVSYYWDQDVAQVDGSRTPEIEVYKFLKDTLITNHILTNNSYSASNTVLPQVIDTNYTSESGASNRIIELANIVINVITTGLSALPSTIFTGVGHIKMPGKYRLEDLLIITDATANEIIYNFAAPGLGGSVTYEKKSDDDFPTFIDTADYVTTLKLQKNTASSSADNEIQLFSEEKEIRTRPFDFGTDAIERMRIAPPLSMLDADFEYGLQPTKWSAIGIMRGYPSVYEIPGTDLDIVSVTTDASAGTGGVGQSKITVTTVSKHNYTNETAVVIKGLEPGISGALRAEGSFVLTDVIDEFTFTYFAKSKVGSAQGEDLGTNFTLLREAGFYTGSAIGSPDWTIISQGTSGNITPQFASPLGSTRLTMVSGSDVPELGAPISNPTYFPTGTQVTGVTGTDGINFVGLPGADINAGDTIATFGDVSGIQIGHAVDNGTGDALFVTNVAGNSVTFDQQFTDTFTAAYGEFTGVSGTTVAGTGAGAQFDISKSGNVYSIDGINGGASYKKGDAILLPGDLLGGSTPTNDATVVVTSVTGGSITTADITGTAFSGDLVYTGITLGYQNGNGNGPVDFDVTLEDNVYSVTVSSPNTSTGFAQGDLLFIQGTSFPPTGNASNDLTIKVTSVGASGEILNVTASGTAPDVEVDYASVSYTTTGAGVGLDIDVQKQGVIYSNVFLRSAGSGFTTSDTVTISGVDLGGITPDNDIKLRIVEVDGSGAIISFDVEGTDLSSAAVAANRDTVFKTAQILSGVNAEFEITNDGTIYTVSDITNAGTDYGTDQTFLIPGTVLGGATPTNDLTLQITQVDGNGAIISVTPSGVSPAIPSSFTNITGVNLPNNGAGATFDIVNSNGTYTITVNEAGLNYREGNQISIDGADLGGANPANNATVTVQTTTITDGVGTATITGSGFIGNTINFIGSVTLSEPSILAVPSLTNINFEALATIQVTWPYAHGLIPGNSFIVTQTSDDNSNNHDLVAGSYLVTSVPASNVITYQARAEGFIDDTGIDSTGTSAGVGTIEATIYPRPDSFFVHRPFDGGVQLGTGGPQHGAQAIRQSKKYIRYQSGKGIMYTTGALFAPSYDLLSVTADGVEVGATITCVTDDTDHGLQIGGIVRLIGINTPGYNSGAETAVPPQFDYTVTNIIDERTFTITAQRRLGHNIAELGFGAQVSVVEWHGATVRSGIFDDQNGIFWEYDGRNLNVVQRTATRQLAGTISCTSDSNLIIGTNTRFRDQIKAGDRIVIKGMTHVVTNCVNQTRMTVTPDFRGVSNVTAAKASLIVDKKIRQDEWNLDKLDGNGPSGYDMDPAKMQMIGIQYSWYGAGFIDYMVRGSDGNFVYCHRIRNSNVNTEAYMRSGNLPVRYEVTNEGTPGKLRSNMSISDNIIPLEDASFFPNSGTVYIDNEMMRYTNKAGNDLIGVTRSATLTNFSSGATRNYTAGPADAHADNTGVVLISNTITPNISHWGSAFITDGNFDDDRGYIFSYTESALEISTTRRSAFLMRLAPSVSNAIVGDLGERDLLNRAQLLLQGIEITSDGFDGSNNPIQGGIVVEGILNPKNYPVNPDDVVWSGLSTQAQGGQPSFTQIASGGGINWTGGATQTTAAVNYQGDMTVTGIQNSFEVDAQGQGRDDYVWVLDSVIQAQGLRAGMVCNTPPFNGLRVTGIGNLDPAFGDRQLFFTNDASNTGTTYPPGALSLSFTFATAQGKTPVAYFEKASWDASNADANTEVDPADTQFPAGTTVNTISNQKFGSTEYVEVTFNNSSTTTLQGGSTVTFLFGQPAYAQPGETVFSFIAQPGERADLTLESLKELTNTTLGGRGTFPNGPDVLAINIYKVSGSATNGNLIIRWGEAQA